MRDFIFLIISLVLGKLIALYNYTIGFNVTFFLILLFIVGSQLLKFTKISYFRKAAMERFRQSNIKVSEPIPKLFWWKFRCVRVSTAQLVLFTSEEGGNLLVVCGSWWFGCLTNQQKIYRKVNGRYIEILN
jgi:uncharacterized membrane protein